MNTGENEKIGENEKMKAAYALNLWTVSISQIIEYNDINIAQQEYDTIMENLNLENMPKDEALLDVIKEILDEVTYLLMEAGLESRGKLNPSLPSPSRCSLKDYKRNREEIERMGTYVIMVGDSEEAQKFYKNVKGGCWGYYKLGMRYVSYGNKTVLLARTLKNEQINELISLAEEVNQKHPVKIPSNAKTIEYKFMKEKFEGKFDNPMNSAKAVINGLVTSPLLIAGQLWEKIRNEVQLGKNLISWNELKFLQYHIAIYQYLKSENAMID